MTADNPESSESRLEVYGIAILGITGIISLIYALSPVFHGAIMFFYKNPWTFEILVASLVLGIIYKRRLDKDIPDSERSFLFTLSHRESSWSRSLKFFTITLFILFIIGGTSALILSDHAMGQTTMQDSVALDKMYEGDADHPRIVTRAQANRWASGSIRSSQYNPTGNAIVIHNNTTHWGSNLVPTSSLRNKFTEKQNGTVLVNAETFEKDVTVVRGDMNIGRGVSIRDNIGWKLESMSSPGPYLATYYYNSTRTIIQNDNQYLAIPYTTPKHYALPLAYSHESSGGVVLVHEDGSFDHLTLEEARNNPVLQEQPLLPPKFVKKKVDSTTYRAGIIDTLPIIGSHTQTISVASVPGENNQQPFYMPTENHGGQYVIAVEPTGGTQGLRELWFVDTRTNQYARYESDQEDTLYGPRKSSDFVIDANDKVDWNKFSPSEPIATVVDNQLYWSFRVVQDGGGGITFVSMVNAHTQGVTNIDDTGGAAAVTKFMNGENVTDAVTPGDPPKDREPVMVIEKRNEDGDVIATMHIYENETFVTKPYNKSTK